MAWGNLIIFTKSPERSDVKTRLSAEIGRERASAVFRIMLDHVVSVGLSSECAVWCFCDGPWDEGLRRFEDKFIPQQGEDLGERMHHAIAHVITTTGEPAVLAGTDCPELASSHISRALYQLKACDVVFGPSSDGGYYLVGMRAPQPGLFKGMEWSTPEVFHRSLDRCLEAGLSCGLVETLRDVDDLESLKKSSIYPWYRATFAS